MSFAVGQAGVDGKDLIFKPLSTEILTGEECVFTLFLPYNNPDTVRLEEPDLPHGAAFKSLKRSQSSGAVSGVQIELTVVFTEEGSHTLPPLAVTVDGARHFIPFAAAEVKANPKNLLPELFVRTDDGAELGGSDFTAAAGKPVMLTVYAQNAAEVASFSWKAPKDALFTEIERFALPFRPADSGAAREIALAKFEWIPFEAGLYALPEIRAAAETFSGARMEIVLPETFVRVLPAAAEKEAAPPETLFARAFDAPALPNVKSAPVSRDVCQRLAELRRAERRSPPWGNARQTRIRFEKEAGLPAGEAEARFFTLFALIGAASAALCALFIAAVFRKMRALIVFSAPAAALCAAGIFYAAKLFAVHGIFAGSEISAAPETSATVSLCPAGTVIRVKKSIGAWCYVWCSGGSGWVLQDDVIIIR
ncbi:MAG: hypothetical protein ACTTKL_05945 [Treponema sp.]